MTISSGTLLGTTTVQAVGGVATFNSLSIDSDRQLHPDG